MKEPVVANSTCLIGLERIGRLDILCELFEPIMIPPKVQDDRKARRWAKSLGLRVIGTAGLLVRAKRQGVLSEVKPILEALKRSNFRLHPSLEKEVLRLAGEE